MKKTITIVLPFLALAGIGCGDDTQTLTPDGAMPDSPMVDTPMPDALPAAPTLGAQIDRMGRPAINTALTDPFWDTGVGNQATNLATHEHKQDLYNAEANPANWASIMLDNNTSVLHAFQGALAAFDGLDRTCGNQLGFNMNNSGGSAYALAGVVVDDELYVDTSHGTCAAFLGVEANALGMANTDCGGRAPSYNVIDVIYNVVAGTPQGTVSNGITSNSGHAASDSTFPFLGAPN
jgi:hypothetical protein